MTLIWEFQLKRTSVGWKKIIGLSWVTAEVVNFITADESERGNPTVYFISINRC